MLSSRLSRRTVREKEIRGDKKKEEEEISSTRIVSETWLLRAMGKRSCLPCNLKSVFSSFLRILGLNRLGSASRLFYRRRNFEIVLHIFFKANIKIIYFTDTYLVNVYFIKNFSVNFLSTLSFISVNVNEKYYT